VVSSSQVFPLIQWHEGMMLSPQHFQRICLRYETLIGYRAELVQPFSWGTIQFEFDRVAILEGIFRVSRLEAVMPDGLVVDYQASEKRPVLEINFGDEVTPSIGVKIHVVVARHAEGNFNKRYISVESEPVPDLNLNENEMTMPVVYPNLRLVTSDKVSNEMTHFPLVEIAIKEEAFGLTDFLPPQLRVDKNSIIGKRVAKLMDLMRRKVLTLEDKLRSTMQDAADHRISELKYTIEHIMSDLPYAEALYYSNSAHPFQLYIALCSIVGKLAPLGMMNVPPVFEAYDHNNINKAITQVELFIQMVIDQLTEAYSMLVMKSVEKRFTIGEAIVNLDEPIVLGIKLESGMSEADLDEWVKHLVVTSESLLEESLRKRVLGADRKVIKYYEPLGIVPPSGVALVLIDNESDYFYRGEPLMIEDALVAANFAVPDTIILYTKS
jgi:type VI secretion system protein ImpJ